MSEKNLKQRIRDGELIYGVSAPVTANRDEMKAIIDKDHYDFVMADSQHSAYNEPQLVEYCNIADSLDIPVHFGLSIPATLTLSAITSIWDRLGSKCLK